ncbi:ArsR/SmtB family transcription factor [Sphingomonas echinoides]|uniref:Winged helix-turn-helix domain-containing protein n=1 Tax=Sphingomonas echinoides TaxID=59803 RepID=A0ABU4PIX7_9SPHN|nr:winged helix-turn-helix domain-containing protein [Sphingomonas echinoides]MDX5983379.1 winged helix-turn-helix domain-containing protein [Sphingomonas echinoides]
MLTTTGIAEIAALIGDPARSAMLVALMDGRALTASELANVAGIMPQTASSHLGRMTVAGLLAVERQGRHRYHRLASETVATMIEGIMAVAAEPTNSIKRKVRTGPRDAAMRRARSCYDHLAGSIAVTVADRMSEQGYITDLADGGQLSAEGVAFLRSIGVDVDTAFNRTTARRLFCRPCLDWSERRPHIAGTIGAALLTACFEHDWIRRIDGSRTISITRAGAHALNTNFGIKVGVQ